MSRRAWYSDKRVTSQGLVEIDFSFLTNNTSAPAVADFRGCGGLTGTDAAANGSVSNSGPSAVASIDYNSSTGQYLVTFADGYRYVVSAFAEINDGSDSYKARVGTISNEGSGATTAVTAVIQVRDMSNGNAANTTGRRISCKFVMKDSGNGT